MSVEAPKWGDRLDPQEHTYACAPGPCATSFETDPNQYLDA